MSRFHQAHDRLLSMRKLTCFPQMDFFNHMKPQYTSPDYLRAHTQNVIQSLKNVDPNAKWIMSGKPFVDDKETWNQDTISGLLDGADEDDIVCCSPIPPLSPVRADRHRSC